MDNLPLKRCSTCQQHKTLDCFHKDKSRKDGHSWRCKTCHAEMNKKYAGKYKELQRIKANIRYHEDLEASKAKARARYAEKNEETRAYHRAWRARNAKQINVRTRQWRLENPEKANKHAHIRRARKAQVVCEPYLVSDVLEMWGTNCHLCGEPIDFTAPRSTKFKGWERGLHLDHVMPISNGGADVVENVKPAHGICNLKRLRK